MQRIRVGFLSATVRCQGLQSLMPSCLGPRLHQTSYAFCMCIYVDVNISVLWWRSQGYPVIKAVAEKFGPVVLVCWLPELPDWDSRFRGCPPSQALNRTSLQSKGQDVDVFAVLLLASISMELMTKVHFDSHLDTFPPMLPGRCWSRDSCKKPCADHNTECRSSHMA